MLGVDIRALEDQTFLADLRLESPDGTITRVDCRPSDGVVLALRAGGVIRVSHDVMNSAQPIHKEPVDQRPMPSLSHVMMKPADSNLRPPYGDDTRGFRRIRNLGTLGGWVRPAPANREEHK